MLWVYFVSYTAVSMNGQSYAGRREIRFEKAIRNIGDIEKIENIIQSSLPSSPRMVMVTNFQYLRNEPIKVEPPVVEETA